MCTWLDQHGFDPVCDRRRLLTAAIRYVFNIVYTCYYIYKFVNYVRLSCNKIKVEFILFYLFLKSRLLRVSIVI